MIGIYKITSPSNKIYIGQSIDIEKRFYYYRKLYCLKQVKLYRSFIKYGIENHQFEIIEECNIENLNNKERCWQEFYDVLKFGLNCILVETDIKSKKMSEETKSKISKTQKAKTEDFKNRLRILNLGRNHSNESKILMSINNNRKKKIICTLTNKIWNSIKDCSIELNINSKTLNNKLTGFRKNNTTLTYLKDE